MHLTYKNMKDVENNGRSERRQRGKIQAEGRTEVGGGRIDAFFLTMCRSLHMSDVEDMRQRWTFRRGEGMGGEKILRRILPLSFWLRRVLLCCHFHHSLLDQMRYVGGEDRGRGGGGKGRRRADKTRQFLSSGLVWKSGREREMKSRWNQPLTWQHPALRAHLLLVQLHGCICIYMIPQNAVMCGDLSIAIWQTTIMCVPCVCVCVQAFPHYIWQTLLVSMYTT